MLRFYAGPRLLVIDEFGGRRRRRRCTVLGAPLAVDPAAAAQAGGARWVHDPDDELGCVRHLTARYVVRFLDWCVSVGLMRMAGNTIQFRHGRLQHWLIGRGARPRAAASSRD